MAGTFTLQSEGYDGRYLQLDCVQTIDVATNKSTISWTLTSTGGNSNNYSTGPTSVYINGTRVYVSDRVSYTTKLFPAAKGSVSGTTVVEHSDDGTKTIAVSLSTAIYNSTVKTVSNNWTLNTIARNPTIYSASSLVDGTGLKVAYNNPGGEAVDKVEVFVYAADDTTLLMDGKEVPKSGTSATVYPSDYEFGLLRAQVSKTSVSAPIRVYVRVKAGEAYLWSSAVNTNFLLKNSAPEISMLITEGNELANFLTDGMSFIKYKSILNYDVEAYPKSGATITSYSIKNGSQTATKPVGIIAIPDSDVIEYSATDSRGYTTTRTTTLPMVDYVNLTCNQRITWELVGDTGAKATLNIYGDYFNGNFGAEDNFLDVAYRWGEADGEWSDWQFGLEDITTISGNYYSITKTFPNLEYNKYYKFQCMATDWLNDQVMTKEYIATMMPVFDWSSTDFRFNVPVVINGDLAVSGTITQDNPVAVIDDPAADYVETIGTSGIWTYRKWHSGIAECWGTVAPTSHNITNAWGALFTKDNAIPRQNYPFTFTEDPVVSMTLHNPVGNCWAYTGTPGGVSQSPAFGLARGTSGSATVGARITAIGRWK